MLNSKLALKEELEDILTHDTIDISSLSRPRFNEVLETLFQEKGWLLQPSVFEEKGDPGAKMDF